MNMEKSPLPIKYFELKDKTKGIFAMGLVQSPAIEEDWVMLKKQTATVFKLKTSNEQKRIITGLALVPEIDILRLDANGNEYNLRFSAQTVEDLGHGLIRNQNQSNVTLDHQVKVDGVHLCESWIVSDLVHDKTVALGLEPVLGALATSYKIDNEDVWNDYIKTGMLTGFSIEAQEGQELSKQKPVISMNKPSLKEGLMSFLTDWGKDEVKLEDYETNQDGVMLVGESLEVGMPLLVKGNEAEGVADVAAPDGDYELADGTKLVVKDGLIESVTPADAPAEEALAEPTDEELKAVELAKAEANKLDEILVALKEQKELVQLSKEDVTNIVTEILTAKLADLPLKMGKMGAPKEEVETKLSSRELSKMSVKERVAYNVSLIK